VDVDKDEMLPMAADYDEAARHYKKISRFLQRGHEQMQFYEDEGNPLSAAQIVSLKSKLIAEKIAGDEAVEAAEARIAS
jgi:hypothetical protein